LKEGMRMPTLIFVAKSGELTAGWEVTADTSVLSP
jgi:hypothetical protein